MGKGFVQQNLMHPSSSLMQNKEGLHNRNLLLNKTGILTISSVSCGSLPAATNMLAISFARHNKQQVNSVLSDGLAIALAVGIILGAVLYCVAPAALRQDQWPQGRRSDCTRLLLRAHQVLASSFSQRTPPPPPPSLPWAFHDFIEFSRICICHSHQKAPKVPLCLVAGPLLQTC